MDFDDVVHGRRMVRNYSAQPVPADSIDRLLDYATRAPSAGFSQGWSFLVLDEPTDVNRFWSAATPPSRAADPDSWLTGMRSAPVVIIPFSSKTAYLDRYAQPDKGWDDRSESRWPIPYWYVDTGMASLLILLGAVDDGLGACFFGIPAARVSHVCDEFSVPSDWTPIGAITVGYPAQDQRIRGSAQTRPRKPLSHVVHRGRWQS